MRLQHYMKHTKQRFFSYVSPRRTPADEISPFRFVVAVTKQLRQKGDAPGGMSDYMDHSSLAFTQVNGPTITLVCARATDSPTSQAALASRERS